jgi:hypothetical protein
VGIEEEKNQATLIVAFFPNTASPWFTSAAWKRKGRYFLAFD